MRAWAEKTLPALTAGCPPPMKNGIDRVAGWPWLPGIGLLVIGLGSEKRQPAWQNTTTSPDSGPSRSHGVRRSQAFSTPGVASAICWMRLTALSSLPFGPVQYTRSAPPLSAMTTLPASSGSSSIAPCSVITLVGIDQSIEWSASTMTIECSHAPLDFSPSMNCPTSRSVSSSAACRSSRRLVPVKSVWPTRSMSPRLTKTRCGSNSSTIEVSAL